MSRSLLRKAHKAYGEQKYQEVVDLLTPFLDGENTDSYSRARAINLRSSALYNLGEMEAYLEATKPFLKEMNTLAHDSGWIASDFFNLYAWVKFNAIQLEDAYIYSKKSVELQKTSHNLDTLAHVANSLGKYDEAYDVMAQAYIKDKDYKASQTLFKNYKSKIQEVIAKNYDTDDYKEKVIREALSDYRIEEPEQTVYVDELMGRKPATPKDFWHWDRLVEKLTDKFVSEEDPILLRIYHHALVVSQSSWGVFVHHASSEEQVLHRFELLQKAGVPTMEIVNHLFEYTDDALRPEMARIISPKLTVFDIPSLQKESANSSGSVREYFESMVLLLDYEGNEARIKQMILQTPYDGGSTRYYYQGYDNLNGVLAQIRDESFVTKIISERLRAYGNDISKMLPKAKVIADRWADYFLTGEKDKDLEKDLLAVGRKMKERLAFASFMLDNIEQSLPEEQKRRLYWLGSFIGKNVLEKLFNVHNNKSEELISKVEDYGINKELVANLYLDVERYMDHHEYPERPLFETVLENDDEAGLNAIRNSTVDGKFNGVHWLWEIDRDKYKSFLLEMASDGSQKVRGAVVDCLADEESSFEDAKELLKAKKQGARESGVRLLMRFDKPEVVEVLKAQLDQEKGKAVVSAINEYFQSKNLSVTTAGSGDEDVSALDSNSAVLARVDKVLKQRSGTDIQKISWLKDKALPSLKWKDDKSEVPVSVSEALIKLFSRNKQVTLDKEALELAHFIHEDSLKPLANDVFGHWDGESKTKWVLGFLAAFGGDALVDKLRTTAKELAGMGRGAMAANYVHAMALMGTSRALQAVDFLRRKERHKQVKNAAINALEVAANELGITADELMDRIVPDFGFSQDGTLVLDYGPRQFTISLGGDLSLAIADDNGKTFKSLPKPGKGDDEEKATSASNFFKQLKKDVREQVKAQGERLEQGLAKNRLWAKESWLKLFAENPLMQAFATGLVWGIYEDGQLVGAFRYMDDGSFNNVEDEEFELPADCRIGMVHPIELAEEELEAWKEQLEDYDIQQPFPQLHRPVYRIKDEQKGEKKLLDFQGFMINPLSLQSKLFKLGWNRGSVQDAGCFYDFYKDIEGHGISVDLNFLGDCVGYSMHDSVPLYDVVFHQKGLVARGSYMYDKPKDGNTFALEQIPARLYSEIYNELKSVADSGTGFNPEWEKVEW